MPSTSPTSGSAVVQSERWGERYLASLFVAALLFFGWVGLRGWTLPLTDSYASRQAQTAITSQMLAAGETDTLTPFNGLGPPWSVPLEFPTYQLITAKVSTLTGASIVSAGRAVSIGGSLITIALLLLLLRRAGVSNVGLVATSTLLLFSPLYAHYSRVVMIETWATALSLGWLLALVEAQRASEAQRRSIWIAAAVVVGVIAAPTKVTTFVLFLTVGGLISLAFTRRRGVEALQLLIYAATPAVFSALIWTRASDAANAAHPYADFLVSSMLSDWVWGTAAQRFDPAWWFRWLHHLDMICPLWTYLAIPCGLVFGNRSQRALIALGLIPVVAGPLIFANLYFVHEYYSMAIAPACITAIAIGGIATFQHFKSRKWPGRLIAATLLVAGGHNLWNYQSGLGPRQMRAEAPPVLTEVIQRLTTPEDTILVYGSDWDPLITFYADRRMAFVRASHETNEDSFINSSAALSPQNYTVLLAVGNVSGDLPFIKHRCRQLGLAQLPAASTADADIYMTDDAAQRQREAIQQMIAENLVSADPVERLPAGQTREVWISPDWRVLVADEANRFFGDVSPLPTQIFAMHRLSTIRVGEEEFVHLHPESALRFKATARPRTLTLRFGMSPELWEQNLNSDGARFRIWLKESSVKSHLAWEQWLNPVARPEDRGSHEITLKIPARRTVQLEIDCGPGRDPGFDWAYIESIRIEP